MTKINVAKLTDEQLVKLMKMRLKNDIEYRYVRDLKITGISIYDRKYEKRKLVSVQFLVKGEQFMDFVCWLSLNKFYLNEFDAILKFNNVKLSTINEN